MINDALARLSDDFFNFSIGTYSAAMLGFTAEYAFSKVAATSSCPSTPVADLVAVGRAAVRPPAPVAVDDAVASTPAHWPSRIGRLSVLLSVIGVVVHVVSISLRAAAVDAVPWSNLYEFASASALISVVAFLCALYHRPQLRLLGMFVLLPVVLLMFLAGTVLYSQAATLVPALHSYWLAIHVTLVSIAEGALMTSAVMTVLFLVKARSEAATSGQTRGVASNLVSRLPAAATLDKSAYRIVAFAFPLYTVAIVCGAIWAEAAWGRYWGWDPKETWAFIVWVLYAAYLHARATAGWKGRSAALINLAGFLAISFNFLIVNIVVSGLHSYAGLN